MCPSLPVVLPAAFAVEDELTLADFAERLAKGWQMCYSEKRIAVGRGRTDAEKLSPLCGCLSYDGRCDGGRTAVPSRGLGGPFLISVPRKITSDCGIAWSAPPELRETLEARFQEAGIETAGFYELLV